MAKIYRFYTPKSEEFPQSSSCQLWTGTFKCCHLWSLELVWSQMGKIMYKQDKDNDTIFYGMGSGESKNERN